jgi:hypothetical protein
MEDKNKVISYHKMRLTIGILAISLPIMLPLGNFLINESNLLNNSFLILKDCHFHYYPFNNFKSSISHYYYTSVGELFVSVIYAVAFFMFCYKGYKKKSGEFWPSDSFITNLAGICALGVAIFPTSSNDCISDNLRTFISSNYIGKIHYAFATVFFVSLCIICFANFRRTSKDELFGKMPSHNFYKYCGWGILISLINIALFSLTPLKNIEVLKNLPIIYFFETTALLFFGASWIKKGLIGNN